jgi:GT2 family glycosyltransferase
MADLEWNTPIGDAEACGGDAMIRVSAYQAVGGFDAALIAGEEPELCARFRTAEWRVHRLDAEMTVHDAAMSRLSQWWNRAVRSGFGYAQAWRATRTGRHPLYRRELLRAGAWTIGPLLLSLVGGICIHPVGWLFAPAAYILQIARLATKFGVGHSFSWRRAGLLTIAKFAEAWGALLYAKRTLSGGTGGTITYK